MPLSGSMTRVDSSQASRPKADRSGSVFGLAILFMYFAQVNGFLGARREQVSDVIAQPGGNTPAAARDQQELLVQAGDVPGFGGHRTKWVGRSLFQLRE